MFRFPAGGGLVRRLVPALLVTVALTACGGGGEGTAGTDGGARANDGPVDVSSLTDVCAGDVRLTQAAPYTGPAPHPIMVFGPPAGNDPHAPPYGVKLLNDVSPELRGGFNAKPSEVQLVGCVERTRETPTDVACHYLGGDRVPFFRASYRMTIREVRTGAVVDRSVINPGAEGCPSDVRVSWGGAKVWGLPRTGQYVQAVQRYTEWNGQGRPPTAPPPAATPRNAGGRELTSGSTRLTAPTGADTRTLAVLQDYLAFWSAYEGAEEQGRPVTDELKATTDARFLSSLSSVISRQSRTSHGPVLLTPTIRTQTADSVIIDDCRDETGREYVENGERTGEIGVRIGISLSMAPRDGHFVVTDFVDAPADLCPPDPG
jgi:hypothetical protein